MTATVNNTTATAELTETGSITLTVGKQKMTLSADEVTATVRALLAGRKDAYEVKRAERTAAQTAAKAEREAKATARREAAEARKNARLEKLRAQLAKLEG